MPRSPVVLSWAGCPRAGSLPCPHAAGTRGQALPGGKAQSTAPGQQQGTEPAPEHSWIISPLLHELTAPGAALALPGGSPSPPAAPISIESGAAPPKRHWSERPSPRNWFGRRGQGEKFPTQNAGSGWPPFNRVPPRSPCAQGHRGDTPAPPQKRTVGSAMGITGTLCPGMLGQPQTMAQHCPSLHLNLLCPLCHMLSRPQIPKESSSPSPLPRHSHPPPPTTSAPTSSAHRHPKNKGLGCQSTTSHQLAHTPCSRGVTREGRPGIRQFGHLRGRCCSQDLDGFGVWLERMLLCLWGLWGRNSPAWLPSHPKGTSQGQQQSQTSLQRCRQPHIFTPKLLDLPVPCFSPPRSLWSCFSKAPGEGADAFAFNLGCRGGVSTQNPSCLQAEGRQQTGFLLLTPVTPFPTRTQGHHPPPTAPKLTAEPAQSPWKFPGIF